MKKIYVGCALTGAPESFLSFIDNLKDDLRERYEVMEFIGPVAGDAQEVFANDSRCVRECDLFLAICDIPSIGLGIELGLATALKKPTIAVAHEDAKVSRMLQGIDNPYFTFKRYRTISDIVSFVDGFSE